MSLVVEALNRWGAEATALAVAAVWQSTVVAALVAVAAYALRRSSPAARYWLWQIVAIKLLVMPFWTWSLAVAWLPGQVAPATGVFDVPSPALVPADALGKARAGRPAAQTHAPGARQPTDRRGAWVELSWRGWLLAGWGAIVLAQVARLGMQRVRLARLLRGCAPGDEGLSSTVRRVAARLGLKRAPRVLVTELECSPFVCGVADPALVVPRGLAASLHMADLEPIVAHELAHVKRRDLAWGWIPEIARTVYFFHPVAHWASNRVRLERELTCDQWAIADSGRSPAEYADTLVRVLASATSPGICRASAAPLDGGAPRERTP